MSITTPRLLHLTAGGVSVVIDGRGSGVPSIVHWGAALPALQDHELAAFADGQTPQIASNSIDTVVPLSILPEAAAGWAGTPGLEGHRDGSQFSAALRLIALKRASSNDARVADRCVVAELADGDAGLEVVIEIELTEDGLLRLRARLTAHGSTPYTLDALRLAVPVPRVATELMDFGGRHVREADAQRHAFTVGTHAKEGRRGRSGHDFAHLYAVGEPSFGFRRGEVWAVQTAWSGNHRTSAERLPNGRAALIGGELLLPGEVRLSDGDSYESPWLYASYGDGLDAVSARIHAFLRARPDYPQGPRPVVLNTWEAVYFKHDLATLLDLADRASEVGVERFVLDDGWFLGRNDKTSSLGDWTVDPESWPEGLDPLVQRVREHGMQFGLWFEPEMINPDSDAARAHPEWIMAPSTDRQPPTARYQQVLDLANPDAFAHVLESMSALIERHSIDFVKWDHNRDLVDAGHPATGRAGVHDQTRAYYRLVATLRERFPRLEIEACSSGGARADLAALEHADRVWASDCIDALERQRIERWMGLTVPPEMLGSHVGAERSHSTKRRHDLSFRAGTALFGHFGIEQDLTTTSDEERAGIAAWVTLYKQHRHWLHRGSVVRGDHPDPAYWLRGVVAADGEEALYALVAMDAGASSTPGAVRFPGLNSARHYRVTPLAPATDILTFNHHSGPSWWRDGIELPGSVLERAGLQAPSLAPEHLALVYVTALPTEEDPR